MNLKEIYMFWQHNKRSRTTREIEDALLSDSRKREKHILFEKEKETFN